MEHPVMKEARAKMEKAVEAFKHELSTIRTGRASIGLLDVVEVEMYGTKMKLNQIATVTAPEPRLLVITPWDKTQIGAIEKAILASPLDLTPSNDGRVVRIPIPPLTEERRKDLVKLLGKLAEEARVAIRNVRRHAVDAVKKDQKDGKIPEDEAHKITGDLQKLTDDYIEKVEDVLKKKEAEVMEV
ncbi:MAG TPA: ribosome recycling factor [Candidatus Hydrogenedentes bacterium]|nr:ribosome recycling factor [Candidatus Hydrogenedentota bacterium]HOL76103.1 ribosome recycling factor [Candidatus Hydrogenedentota bacterium]HPO84717.1 ribosome recycling factor [Candidatus Hydrogenedentota bacterium]